MSVAKLTLRFGATRLQASVRWRRLDKGWLALALADELTLVCNGDPRDDGARYAALLRDAGVDVDQVLR
jgi:hypothetical protein